MGVADKQQQLMQTTNGKKTLHSAAHGASAFALIVNARVNAFRQCLKKSRRVISTSDQQQRHSVRRSTAETNE